MSKEVQGFIHKDWGKILKHKRIDIIVNSEQMKTLLMKIGNDVDGDGFIVDARTGQRVISNYEKEIHIDHLGAVIPGTKNFVRKNIASFSQFLSEHSL